jgi:hypothetical protein
VADTVKKFARRTQAAERQADRVECRSVFIDSFTPDEKRQFLSELAFDDEDGSLRDSLLRIIDRLPSSPGLLRVLADYPDILPDVVGDADQDPDASLSNRILRHWIPRAFRDEQSLRVLACIAAAQCLQVNLEALKAADDWLVSPAQGSPLRPIGLGVLPGRHRVRRRDVLDVPRRGHAVAFLRRTKRFGASQVRAFTDVRRG